MRPLVGWRVLRVEDTGTHDQVSVSVWLGNYIKYVKHRKCTMYSMR